MRQSYGSTLVKLNILGNFGEIKTFVQQWRKHFWANLVKKKHFWATLVKLNILGQLW
jgi:hypothetical protein